MRVLPCCGTAKGIVRSASQKIVASASAAAGRTATMSFAANQNATYNHAWREADPMDPIEEGHEEVWQK